MARSSRGLFFGGRFPGWLGAGGCLHSRPISCDGSRFGCRSANAANRARLPFGSPVTPARCFRKAMMDMVRSSSGHQSTPRTASPDTGLPSLSTHEVGCTIIERTHAPNALIETIASFEHEVTTLLADPSASPGATPPLRKKRSSCRRVTWSGQPAVAASPGGASACHLLPAPLPVPVLSRCLASRRARCRAEQGCLIGLVLPFIGIGRRLALADDVRPLG